MKSALPILAAVTLWATSASAQLPAFIRIKGGVEELQRVYITGMGREGISFKPDLRSPASATIPAERIEALEFELPEDFIVAASLRRTGNLVEAYQIYQRLAGPYMPFAAVEGSNALPLFVEVADTGRMLGAGEASLKFLAAHFPRQETMPPALRYVRAAILLGLGDTGGAARAAEDVPEIDPGEPYFLLQQIVLAEIAAARGDPLGAADIAAKGLALGNTNSVHYPELLATAAAIYESLSEAGGIPEAAAAATDADRILASAESSERIVAGRKQILDQLARFYPSYKPAAKTRAGAILDQPEKPKTKP